MHNDMEEAERVVQWFGVFGDDYYLELQLYPLGRSAEAMRMSPRTSCG